jgi:hypothetical protein
MLDANSLSHLYGIEWFSHGLRHGFGPDFDTFHLVARRLDIGDG